MLRLGELYMSTTNKETVKQLEVEIKETQDKDPCKALKSSLIYLHAKGWLSDDNHCESTIRAHAFNLGICRPVLREERPADKQSKWSCERAAEFQMEAAKCKVKKTLIMDENGLPVSLKDPRQANMYGDTHANSIRSGYVYSPNPLLAFFQRKNLIKNPAEEEMDEMARALHNSYELYNRCYRKA